MELMRLMVMLHHSTWAVMAVFFVGIGALVYGSYIQNRVSRTIVLGLAVVAFGLLMAAGSIAPLDQWQHQHGACLLDSLPKGKEVPK